MSALEFFRLSTLEIYLLTATSVGKTYLTEKRILFMDPESLLNARRILSARTSRGEQLSRRTIFQKTSCTGTLSVFSVIFFSLLKIAYPGQNLKISGTFYDFFERISKSTTINTYWRTSVPVFLSRVPTFVKLLKQTPQRFAIRCWRSMFYSIPSSQAVADIYLIISPTFCSWLHWSRHLQNI